MQRGNNAASGSSVRGNHVRAYGDVDLESALGLQAILSVTFSVIGEK
jgi:hypothetical protein